MYGAMIGDVVGSVYEFQPIETKNFELFPERATFTDDTVMTIAVARALMSYKKYGGDFKEILVEQMQHLGNKYPTSYGGMFSNWLHSTNPEPYNSYGNGSAMRVSPIGLYANSIEETLDLAKQSAEVTHNHPEGIKGAQATAVAVFLAKTGEHKDYIRAYIHHYFYPLDFTLDDIRENYHFDVTCQGSVPPAIVAFLESTSFEDAIRNAISLGGDSDTLAAITGGIAWPYYLVQNHCELPDDMHMMGFMTMQRIPNEFHATDAEFNYHIDPYKDARVR